MCDRFNLLEGRLQNSDTAEREDIIYERRYFGNTIPNLIPTGDSPLSPILSKRTNPYNTTSLQPPSDPLLYGHPKSRYLRER